MIAHVPEIGQKVLHAEWVTHTELGLLRPDLWNLLLPALKAGQAYAADGRRYVPRQTVTEYEENNAGWPQMTTDVLRTRTTSGPMNWSDMFGLEEGSLTRILASDVPELEVALHEISGRALEDHELMQGVSLMSQIVEPEQKRSRTESELLRFLIGPILNRADAIGAQTDEQLRSIYQELEQARFASELSGDVIVPLVAVSFDAELPVPVEETIWIERLTQSDQRVRAMPWVRSDNASPYVAAAATHAVVLRGVRFPNRVHTLFRGMPPGLDANVAQIVAEAVHIVTEKSTGYAQILVRPHGWAESWEQDLPPLWSAWSGRAYPEELDDRRWDKDFSRINATETDQIVRITRALKIAPQNVQIAARRCRRTTFRDDREDMVLDTAIGIEALVGKEKDAVTHRLAQRAAIALADRIPPENTYRLLKKFYDIRSDIAHGDPPKRWTIKLDENEWDAIETGRFFLRELLQDRLLAAEPWDATSLDQRMLERFERSEGYGSVDPAEA